MTAIAPDTEERIRRILSGHELLIVNDLQAAEAALRDDGVQLIFVGARFDQSRMFTLLDFIRQQTELKKIPIVAAIIAPTRMSAETIGGLEHTTKIFGATVFINLNDFKDDETQTARLRLMVETLLLPPDRIPLVAQHFSPNDGGIP